MDAILYSMYVTVIKYEQFVKPFNLLTSKYQHNKKILIISFRGRQPHLKK